MPAVDWGRPPDETTHVRAKLHAMVVEYEARDAEPLPEGVLLAAACDAHTMLVRVREALGALSVDANIEALEQRVNQARAAAAMGAGDVPDDARLRVEACHRAVVDAEARARGSAAQGPGRRDGALRGSGRGRVGRARRRRLRVVRPRTCSTLTGGGVAADEGARRAAEDELAAARAALDAGREIPDVPTGLELDEREAQMRARADPAARARPGARSGDGAPRAPTRARGARRCVGRDRGAAAHEGIPTGPDVLSAARAYLTVTPKGEKRPKPAEPAAAPPKPAAEPVGKPLEIPPNVVDPERSREVADLEEQKWTLDRRLARLEAQLARVDEANAAPVVRLSAADFILTLGSVLDGYEHGDLLAGRLPLGARRRARRALGRDVGRPRVEVFARAEAVQTVVVTARSRSDAEPGAGRGHAHALARTRRDDRRRARARVFAPEPAMIAPERVRAVVDAYVDSYRRNDKQACLDLFAPDAVWHDPVGEPPHVGHEGVGAFWDRPESMAESIELVPQRRHRVREPGRDGVRDPRDARRARGHSEPRS